MRVCNKGVCFPLTGRTVSEPLHPIVQEEINLLAEMRTKLEERPAQGGASEKQIVAELLILREEMPNAKAEDLGALFQQFDSLHALLKQLRSARNHDVVDPDNPYFAHMRLREDGKERDLYLGRVTRIDHGLRIIDWRNAPIARIFSAMKFISSPLVSMVPTARTRRELKLLRRKISMDGPTFGVG